MTISLIAILRMVLQSAPRAIGIQEEINVLSLLLFSSCICICMLELGRRSYYRSFSGGDLRGNRGVRGLSSA